jgi:hypothetical protein
MVGFDSSAELGNISLGILHFAMLYSGPDIT